MEGKIEDIQFFEDIYQLFKRLEINVNYIKSHRVE